MSHHQTGEDPYYSGELDHLPTASVDTARHQLSISPIPKLPMIILQKLKPVSVLIKYEDFLRYRNSHKLLTDLVQCLNQLPDHKLNHSNYASTYELCTALEEYLKEPPGFGETLKSR